MTIRGNGSYLGPRPTGPTTSVAGGWWDLRNQFRYKREAAWPLSPGDDQFFNDVTLLIQDDIVDESLQRLSLTVGGNAAKSTTQVKVGTHSIALNGGSDRISAASANVINFGTGPFTVEAWFYITSSNNQMWLEGPSNNGFQFFFENGVIKCGISGTPAEMQYTAPGSFVNSWVHLAVVREGTGTNQTHLYYNGSKVASATNSHNYTTTGFQISRTSSYLFYGYFDALRVTKAARYVANFTPSTSPWVPPSNDPNFSSVSLLLHFDGTNGSTTFTDSSSNAHVFTATGNAQISTAQSKFGGSSLYLDGTGDSISATLSSALQVGTGAFTLECWCYCLSLATPGSHVGSEDTIWNTSTAGLQLNVYNGVAGLSSDNIADLATFSSASITTNTWFHIALCKSGSTTRCFVNGTQAGSNYTDNNNYTGTSTARLGGRTNTDRQFYGYIDEFRLTKGVARYTANFIAPTAPFPDA